MVLQNLDPQDVARWLAEKSIVLVDVREPSEYAAERIAGALLFPTSTFDPAALPDLGARKVVFLCGSGARSAKAVAACEAAGLAIDSHMRGGMQAWKAAGLPVLRADPATGKMRQT
jgi:rhodanese-related sulfurtransferase